MVLLNDAHLFIDAMSRLCIDLLFDIFIVFS